MSRFCDINFRPFLAQLDLNDFDRLWNLKAGWVEEPNQGRSGWSGVTRLKLQNSSSDLYIKRQQNHNTRTLLNPFRGIPTFRREFRAAQLLQRIGIPCVKPVFYCERTLGGKHQAILITRDLAGYVSAEEFIQNGSYHKLSRTEKIELFDHLADLLRNMHSHHIQHSSLYTKHVFIRMGELIQIKLIDLEKLRRRVSVTTCQTRDFYHLEKNALSVSLKDKVLFLKRYFREDKISAATREIIDAIGYKIEAREKRPRARLPYREKRIEVDAIALKF